MFENSFLGAFIRAMSVGLSLRLCDGKSVCPHITLNVFFSAVSEQIALEFGRVNQIKSSQSSLLHPIFLLSSFSNNSYFSFFSSFFSGFLFVLTQGKHRNGKRKTNFAT
jgi:hypothetical protein